MKKILLSSIVLITFSLSIILFQVSCKKEAIGQTITTHATTISGDTVKQQGKILFIKLGLPAVTSAIWMANYDGSNPQQLNIDLPPHVAINGTVGGNLSISPDHKTIFFTAGDTTTNHIYDVYSANIDGSNAQKILSDSYKVVPY